VAGTSPLLRPRSRAVTIAGGRTTPAGAWRRLTAGHDERSSCAMAIRERRAVLPSSSVIEKEG